MLNNYGAPEYLYAREAAFIVIPERSSPVLGGLVLLTSLAVIRLRRRWNRG